MNGPFIVDVISMLLNGVGLLRSASSAKSEAKMVALLEEIRTLLAVPEDSSENSAIDMFLARHLWERWSDVLRRDTIMLVTGCHELPETFDRPIAYAIKFAIDHIGQDRRHQPLHSLVMGDRWFRENFADWPLAISLGGPVINNLTGDIMSRAAVLHRGDRWTIAKVDRRYAVFGNDPKDTLEAMNVFSERELVGYLNAAWA
jgi:hypothetical protein